MRILSLKVLRHYVIAYFVPPGSSISHSSSPVTLVTFVTPHDSSDPLPMEHDWLPSYHGDSRSGVIIVSRVPLPPNLLSSISDCKPVLHRLLTALFFTAGYSEKVSLHSSHLDCLSRMIA